jgi:hypothetical protein
VLDSNFSNAAQNHFKKIAKSSRNKIRNSNIEIRNKPKDLKPNRPNPKRAGLELADF